MNRCLIMALSFVLVAAAQHAVAEPPCDEPTDAAYFEAMQGAHEAIASEDYETALERIEWARVRYDYAILDFSAARALHHLGRYDEAGDAYARFLSRFVTCADPNDLAHSARSYRARTIRELLGRRATEDQTTTPEEPTTSEEPLAAMEPVEAEALEAPEEPPETDQPHGPDPGGSDDGTIDPGWWVIAAGGALVVSGIGYDLANMSLNDTLETARENRDEDTFNETVDAIQNARVIDGLLYGAGVAAIITGVVLIVTNDDENDEGLTVGPSTRGFGVSFGRSF